MMSKEKFDINKAVSIVILCAGLCSTLTSYATAPKNEIKTNSGTIIQPELKLKVSLPTESEVVRETEIYTVPSALLTVHPEFKTIKERNLYRTVGGVRLQITITDKFINEKELAQLDKLEWKISKKGRLCKDYKYTKDNGNCNVLEANSVFNKGTHPDYTNNYTFYWEPEEWTTDLDAEVQLLVTFKKDAEDKKIFADKLVPFVIKSRVIKALDNNGKQIKGSDVAMLESMLRHLGMSPSGKPGSGAVHLTGSKKKTFGTGTPSVGRMIGRFNYSNFGFNVVVDKKIVAKGVKNTTQEMHAGKYVSPGDGKTYEVLERLEQHWRHYKMAYDNVSTTPFKIDNLSADDLNNAVAIFDGGTMSYSTKYDETGTVMNFSATYTADEHKKISDYKAFTRADILKAMASREASSLHWGNKGAHRMHVGGADELGSNGFNQIQNMYTYGSRSSQGDHRDGARCYWVSAYSLSGKSIVNHYDPSQNILAKAAFLAGGGGTNGGGDCGRSFYKGFHQKLFTATHDLNSAKLITTKTGAEKYTVVGSYKDDTYEVLIKALGAYNQGAGTFNTVDSWSELLIKQKYKGDSALDTAMEYGYDILHSSARGINLPDRIYIWDGGKYPVDLKDASGQPDPKAGTQWCFAYGEKEWVAGDEFEIKKTAATGTALKPAVGRLNCVTGSLL
jgi:hypothetical protein